MREDDMLRLSLECATLAIRGDDYCTVLTTGAEKILNADALLVMFSWPQDPTGGAKVTLGSSVSTPEQLSRAGEVVARHPSHRALLSSPVNRVSDQVNLASFWDTEVWAAMHGHNNGRFPASVSLRCHSRSIVFLGLHRVRSDFTDDDMEVLDVLHGPLAPALTFRYAWEQATQRLQQSLRTPPDHLTQREAQVLALVSRGWTNRRIGHILGITERTVRKHLENVNAKLGVSNRAAAATRWVQASGQVPPTPR